MKICSFKYLENKTPEGYKCGKCGAFGVQLFRKYQTFLDQQELFCRECAMVDQDKNIDQSSSFKHAIGWLVAAVPTEYGETFWGFTSVPDDGVAWWDNLPVK